MKSLSVSLTKKQCILGWLWWVFQILFLAEVLDLVNPQLPFPFSEARLNFVYFAINFAAITVILGGYIKASFGHGIKNLFRTLRWAGIGLIVYYGCAFLLGLLVTKFFPDFVNINDNTLSLLMQDEPVLLRIGVLFLVPVAEELMYRSVIFGSLHRRNRILAYVISASLFSLVHFIGYEPDLLTFAISFVLYLPAGLCLALAYERSGSILAPILMHMAVNQLGTQLMR